MNLQDKIEKLFGKQEDIKFIYRQLELSGGLEEASKLLNDSKGYDSYFNRFNDCTKKGLNRKATFLMINQVEKYKTWMIKKYGLR